MSWIALQPLALGNRQGSTGPSARSPIQKGGGFNHIPMGTNKTYVVNVIKLVWSTIVAELRNLAEGGDLQRYVASPGDVLESRGG